MCEKKCGCQGICATSPATNIKLSNSTLARRAWRIISSETSIPTTRPWGTSFANRRDSQPEPQPTSRMLFVGASCIFSRTGSVMGRWSCPIPSPRPASAHPLNSSRNKLDCVVSGMPLSFPSQRGNCWRAAILPSPNPAPKKNKTTQDDANNSSNTAKAFCDENRGCPILRFFPDKESAEQDAAPEQQPASQRRIVREVFSEPREAL